MSSLDIKQTQGKPNKLFCMGMTHSVVGKADVRNKCS